jgi:hypothetical protein
MPSRRMSPKECISCVEGKRASFLAANALAISALEASVVLDDSGSNAVALAPITANVLKGVGNDYDPRIRNMPMIYMQPLQFS